MFLLVSSARISGESSFIALVVWSPSVSQPASATTAASAAEVIRAAQVTGKPQPHAPRPVVPKRSRQARTTVSVILKDEAITRQDAILIRRSSTNMVNER